MAVQWVIKSKLARGQRPGYGGERGAPVSRSQVDGWIKHVETFGVRSIICLLADDQLGLYESLPSGLVDYYTQAGSP
jgi:hypothetical protein